MTKSSRCYRLGMAINMKGRLALFFFVFAFCFLSVRSSAQEIREIDYQKIKRNISKKNSELYYQKIFDSYISFSEELNKEQYLHIYYGSIHTELYHVYATLPTHVNNMLDQESLSEKELGLLENKLGEALRKDYYNPDILWLLYYINSELEDGRQLDILKSHYVGIISAILSSGTGKSQLSPIKVIHENHVSAVIDFYELEPTSSNLTEEGILKVSFAENSEEIADLYFDLSAYQDRKNDYKEDKKQKPKVKLVVNKP